MIKKQIGKEIKRLKTNNGLEFYPSEFDEFYKMRISSNIADIHANRMEWLSA